MFYDNDAPEATFPLLGLPDNLITDVIQSMDLPEIFGFSLISNKSALLVKSLNCEADTYAIVVDSAVDVTVSFMLKRFYTFRFYESELLSEGEVSKNPPKDLYPPGYVRLYLEGTELGTFEKKEFTMKNWMDHICKIFNQPGIYLLEFKPTVFSAQSVKETFPKFNQLRIECCNEDYELMMNIFNYSTSIDLTGCEDDRINELEIIPKVLIQYFNCAETDVDLKLSLDNLLICNAQSLTVGEIYLTNKEINTFLKCWMKGACPNLKHAYLRVNTEKALDLNVVWKGIKRQDAPENRTNWCGTCKDRDFMAFEGGVDIYRYDGTVATILIEDLHGFYGNCDLKMFVQH